MEIDFEGPHITVGQLLKKLDIVSSGGEVKVYLEDNGIRVNGELEHRRGRKLYGGDLVEIEKQTYHLRGQTDATP